MTAAQEQKIKDLEYAKRARKWIFNPEGVDRWDRRDYFPVPGTVVVKVQPYGCPRNGTMGQCYIGNAETGEFIGMVDLQSLTPRTKKG